MENDIWGSEKIFLIESLEKRILNENETVRLKDIQKLQLPAILHGSLANQAKLIFKTERPVRIFQSDRFELDNMEIRREVSALREAFLGSVNFTKEEIIKAVEFSVNLGFDALTRPAKICLLSLYQQSLERTRSEVLAILKGISSFSPFIETLIEIINTQHQDLITKKHFQQLIKEVQTTLYAENPLPVFSEELRQVLQFYAEIDDEMRDQLSSEIIYGMLVERELHTLAGKFKEHMQEQAFWSMGEVLDFLTLRLDGQAIDTPLREKELEQTRQKLNIEMSDEENDDEMETAFSEVDEPRDEQIELAEDIEEEDIHINLEQDEINLEDFPEQYAQPSEKKMPSLASLIDLQTKEIFINSLFDRDGDAYADFIENLNDLKNWIDAKRKMDLEFKKRNISPFSREAVKFSDLLFNRYFSRGNY